MTAPANSAAIMRGPRLLQYIADGRDSFVAVIPMRFVPVRYVQFRNSTPATTLIGDTRS